MADQYETAELDGLKIGIDPSFSETISTAIRRGGYEAGERNVIPRLLRPGDRILEVGSAIGVVTMTAARIVGAANVLGFEANPALLSHAERNGAMNGLPIRVVNAVLQNQVCWGGFGTSVPFYVHRDYWASSLAPISGTVETVQVPTLCFETEARAFHANVLICDIEGGEIGLLEHADLTGFDRILMEIHYWAGRAGVNRMLRKLVRDGFNVDFDLSGRSIVTLHRGLEKLPAS